MVLKDEVDSGEIVEAPASPVVDLMEFIVDVITPLEVEAEKSAVTVVSDQLRTPLAEVEDMTCVMLLSVDELGKSVVTVVATDRFGGCVTVVIITCLKYPKVEFLTVLPL